MDEVPIEKECLRADLRPFVERYSGEEVADRVNNDDVDFETYTAAVFYFDVVIVAVSRRTLAWSIYFKHPKPSLSPYLRVLQEDDEPRIDGPANRPRRAEVKRNRSWVVRYSVQNSAIERRELGFFFQDEKFGIMLQSKPISSSTAPKDDFLIPFPGNKVRL